MVYLCSFSSDEMNNGALEMMGWLFQLPLALIVRVN